MGSQVWPNTNFLSGAAWLKHAPLGQRAAVCASAHALHGGDPLGSAIVPRVIEDELQWGCQDGLHFPTHAFCDYYIHIIVYASPFLEV